jgi:YhcH/YjgK/YiaL family protein
MIIDRIENAPMYIGLGPRIAQALRHLQSADLAALAPGKHDLDGENLFVVVAEYETKPIDQAFYEAHRKYIDIQLLARGTERMGYAHVKDLKVVEPYDAERDFVKLKGDGQLFTVRPGEFVLFAPHDAHMPALAVDKPQPAKKIVLKIRTEG